MIDSRATGKSPEHHEKVQASVYLISEATHRSRNLDELYRTIHEVITDLMPARNNFYIALHDPKTDLLSYPYFVDEFEDPPGTEKTGRGLTEYVLRTGCPLLASPEVFRDLERQGEVVSVGPPSIDWLGVPLKAGDGTFGVLVVQSYTEGARFTEVDKDILMFISEQVAMAIVRRRAEESLRESEQLFRSLVENSHHGILIVDDQYVLTYANEQLAHILGYPLPEVIGRDFRGFLDKASRAMVADRYARRMRGDDVPSRYDFDIVRKNGEKRRVEIISNLVQDSGNRIQTITHVRDITESRKLTEELNRQRELYRDLVEKADIAILIDDRAGRITYFNETFTRIFGYRSSEAGDLLGTSIVHPDDVERVKKTHLARMQGRKAPRSYEFRGLRKDGSIIHCQVDAVPLLEGERIFGTRSYIRDISEQKAGEERLRNSLHEKEILLKEIHHRVKNNLQVIISLLNLQARHIKDPQALGMFEESRRRVRSIAMVHEKLYRSDDLSRVNFGEYLRSLSLHLFQMFGVNPELIRLDIEAPDIYLDINTAIPSGLLVSELASNSIKHAFPEGRNGNISIHMRKLEDGEIELSVRDDGIGLRENLDPSQSDSFGLQLVSMLAEQLRGEITIDRSAGTNFIVRFKPLHYSNKD